MAFQKVARFLVLVVSMLLANMLATYIDEYFMSYKGSISPEVFTLIGMLVVVAVYYPLFTKLDAWSIKFTQKIVKAGKSVSSPKVGAISALLILLVALFYFYGQMWFGANLILRFF